MKPRLKRNSGAFEPNFKMFLTDEKFDTFIQVGGESQEEAEKLADELLAAINAQRHAESLGLLDIEKLKEQPELIAEAIKILKELYRLLMIAPIIGKEEYTDPAKDILSRLGGKP